MQRGPNAHDVVMGWIIPALLRGRVKVAVQRCPRDGDSSNACGQSGWVDVVSFRCTGFLGW